MSKKILLLIIILFPALFFITNQETHYEILRVFTHTSQFTGIIFCLIVLFLSFKYRLRNFYSYIALAIGNSVFIYAGYAFIYEHIYEHFGIFTAYCIVSAHLLMNYAHLNLLNESKILSQ